MFKRDWLLVSLPIARDKFCVGKQQIGPSLAPFYSKSLYRHMVLLFDIENPLKVKLIGIRSRW